MFLKLTTEGLETFLNHVFKGLETVKTNTRVRGHVCMNNVDT